MNLKISRNTLAKFTVILILIEANYWALLSKVLISDIRFAVLGLSSLGAFVYLNGKIKKQVIYLLWILYLAVVLINNKELAAGVHLNTVRIVLCLSIVFVGMYSEQWIKNIPRLIVLVGCFNVFFTWLFFLNNSLYEKFIALTYKAYQPGTYYGAYGYRAGIADHYSQNGTYITIVCLALIASLLSDVETKKKKSIAVLAVISIGALLLTTKRAHLMFGIAAVILTYYALNPAKVFQKTFRLMLVVVLLLIVGPVITEMIPQLGDTLLKIQNVGTDSSSLTRISMWTYAWQTFLEHPIMGIGWFGIRYSSLASSIVDATTGCHNIYLELLAETGIIGFSVFAIAAVSSVIITFKSIQLLNYDKEYNAYRPVLVTSLAIQIFCLIYGLTGNMIYDRTFHFYIICVAASLAFYINVTKKGRTRNEEYI